MGNRKFRRFSLLFIIPLFGMGYYYFFKGRSEDVKFGKPADKMRERVKVPVIGSDMSRVRLPDNVSGGRWEGRDPGFGVVHLWKMVTPDVGRYVLAREFDSFKKYEEGKAYWQLTIASEIFNDSFSVREGRLWLRCDGCADAEYILDEAGLDSISGKWGLKMMSGGSGN